MPDLRQSTFDKSLDRAAKVAGVLLPVIMAIVGGIYTYQKDKNDDRLRDMQANQDLSQKQYSNLTSLLPLLLSKDPASVSAALNVYTEETKVGQAPLSLKGIIEQIGNTQPEHRLPFLTHLRTLDRRPDSLECRWFGGRTPEVFAFLRRQYGDTLLQP